MQPTVVTWILVIFGAITLMPLVVSQLVMLVSPHSQRASDVLVAKGESWRDDTHFGAALGCAWADWLLLVPLMVAGSIGVLRGQAWGYVLWCAAGSISLYINIVLWFMEKKYVYPSRGALVYFTYYWGFFVYWGGLALVYSVLRVIGIDL